jgi:hypothetical protein
MRRSDLIQSKHHIPPRRTLADERVVQLRRPPTLEPTVHTAGDPTRLLIVDARDGTRDNGAAVIQDTTNRIGHGGQWPERHHIQLRM